VCVHLAGCNVGCGTSHLVEVKVDGRDIVRLSILRPKIGQECHEDDVVVEAGLGLTDKPPVVYPEVCQVYPEV
jgi:hypothetical protein